MKVNFLPFDWLLVYAVAFYMIGACLMKREDAGLLIERGYAKQESYTYFDGDGEEHEGETLVELSGLGKVLTYKEVYFATIPFWVVSWFIGGVLFNSKDELRFMIYTNCILGLLLIWLTTKPNIVSTVLYWCGIFAAYLARRKNTVLSSFN